jgi:hypothetical protein
MKTALDRIAASAGLWAVLWLAGGYAVTATAAANAAGPDADYVRALVAERMKWEWVTFARLVGGILILGFMATLAGRLRLAEGAPGRLGSSAFGIGVMWAGIWLLSGFFNSASILLATTYADPAGARIAGILARETPYVLTPMVVFALLLTVSAAALRFGGFPRSYAYGTCGLAAAILILALADWAGAGTLAPIVVAGALVWMAATSALFLSGRGAQ